MSARPAGACEPGWSGLDVPAPNGVVLALATYDPDGAGVRGRELIAGGAFAMIGGGPALSIARWNGVRWATLGPGLDAPVRALLAVEGETAGALDGRLIVAGEFQGAGALGLARIAVWDGAQWSALGGGFDGPVLALALFDADGPGGDDAQLYAGGLFANAGVEPASNLARWDGAAWHAVGGGTNNEVRALTLFDDDGAGPRAQALYVGGWFTTVGASVAASRVARWDGGAWEILGTGLGEAFPVVAQTLLAFDADGPGPGGAALYAGGFYRFAGGAPALGLARWDGVSWEEVGGGVGTPAEVRELLVADEDGEGVRPATLFVGGSYAPVVGGPANCIARWTGSAWETMEPGANSVVEAMALFDDDGPGGSPPAVYIGGGFTSVGGLAVARLARWGCPRSLAPICPDANGDGTVNFSDLTSVLTAWGSTYVPETGPGDVDRSGEVDFADLTKVLTSWGQTCPVGR